MWSNAFPTVSGWWASRRDGPLRGSRPSRRGIGRRWSRSAATATPRNSSAPGGARLSGVQIAGGGRRSRAGGDAARRRGGDLGDRRRRRAPADSRGAPNRPARRPREQGIAGGGRRGHGARRRRIGRPPDPGGQRTRGDPPVPRRPERSGAASVADRLRRPVPDGLERRDRGGNPGDCAPPSHLADGAQDQHRFGDDDEQGTRDDRGALALRCAARLHPGGGPPGVDRALDGGVRRRLHRRPARRDSHAGAGAVRAHLARAASHRAPAAGPRPAAGAPLHAA